MLLGRPLLLPYPAGEVARTGHRPSGWAATDRLCRLSLVPRQHTTVGKPRLGRSQRWGGATSAGLLIIGAIAVVGLGSPQGRGQGVVAGPKILLPPKPRLVAARGPGQQDGPRSVWAMLGKGEDYRGS